MKYDLSKMIYVEKCKNGYDVRMTRADGQDVHICWYDAKDRGMRLAEFNAVVHAQHILTDILNIMSAVSETPMPQLIVEMREEE